MYFRVRFVIVIRHLEYQLPNCVGSVELCKSHIATTFYKLVTETFTIYSLTRHTSWLPGRSRVFRCVLTWAYFVYRMMSSPASSFCPSECLSLPSCPSATLSFYLWSPYVIGQTIIFSSCFFLSSSFFLWPPYVIGGLLYFCPVVSFLLLLLLFFPRLISAAVDRMSAILLHMAWP